MGVELPKSHFSPETLLKNTTCPNFLQFLFLAYFSSNTSDSSDKQGARARPCRRTDGCVLWTCSSSPPLGERWNSVTAQNYRRKQSPQPCDGIVEVMFSDYFHLQLWNHNEEGSAQEPVYKAVLGYFFSSITFMDVLQSHCPDGHVTRLWQQKQPYYKCKGRAEEQTLNVYMNKNVLFIFTHGFTAQIPPEWIMTFGWQTYGNILNDTGIWLNHPMKKKCCHFHRIIHFNQHKDVTWFSSYSAKSPYRRREAISLFYRGNDCEKVWHVVKRFCLYPICAVLSYHTF